jgi:FKBP-type peptidyl-prolyl cis-trans isomerase FklB
MQTGIVTLMSAAFFIACCPKQEEKKSDGPAAAAATPSAEITKESLKTDIDKLNYAIGIEIGRNVKRNGLELQDDIFLKGIKDGSEKEEAELLLDEKTRQDVKREHARAQKEEREKKRKEEAEKNKQEGEKFLAENKTKDGVVTIESGLQYKILKEGTGKKPTAEDTVSVHYVGTLVDGTEFDSSVKRGKPSSFRVNRVVKGWTEALQMMPVGSKWQLFIPSELGYGERGSRGKIGPNAVLIFEVELLEIKDPNEDKKPGAPAAANRPKKPADKKPAAEKKKAE